MQNAPLNANAGGDRRLSFGLSLPLFSYCVYGIGEVKAQTRLCICTVLSEPLLLTDAISTSISCADSPHHFGILKLQNLL